MDCEPIIPKRVLIIAMDTILLQDMKTILEETEGYQVDCTPDFQEGLSKLKNQKYNMVVLEPVVAKRGNSVLERASVVQPDIWSRLMEQLREDRTPCMFFSVFDESKMPEEYRLARERGYSIRLKPTETLELLKDIYIYIYIYIKPQELLLNFWFILKKALFLKLISILFICKKKQFRK